MTSFLLISDYFTVEQYIGLANSPLSKVPNSVVCQTIVQRLFVASTAGIKEPSPRTNAPSTSANKLVLNDNTRKESRNDVGVVYGGTTWGATTPRNAMVVCRAASAKTRKPTRGVTDELDITR
jgi:hypothetical protein